MKPRIEAETFAAFAVGAIIAGIFLKFQILDAPLTLTDPRVGDLMSGYYPTLKYGFAQLRSGHVPLWNPYQLAGAPFLAEPYIGFFYPLYLPYLFLRPELAFNLDIVLHLSLSAFGMFLLCRHFRMAWGASLIAGIVYSYQGSMMINVYYPDFLAPVAWIPYIFLLTDRILLKPSWRISAMLALVGGVSLMGGHGVQFAYFTILALLVFVALRSAAVFRRQPESRLRVAAQLATAAVLAILIALVRLLPAAEVAAQSWRPPGNSAEVVSSGLMPVHAFAMNLVTPGPPPQPQSAWSTDDIDRQAYVGVLALALAVVGAVLWRERSVSLSIGIAGVSAALYSMGPRAFLHPLMFRLPLGSWFRGTNRALVIFGFAVAILCAAGVDRLMRSIAEPHATGGRALRTPVLVAIASLSAVFLLGLAVGDARGTRWLAVHMGLGVVALGCLTYFGAYEIVRLAATAAIGGLILCDLFHAHRLSGVVPSRLEKYFSRYEAFFQEIRRRQQFDRTYIWSRLDHDPLYFYSDIARAGLVHGIWLPTDYAPLPGRRVSRYMDSLGAPLLPGYRQFTLSAENLGLVQLLSVRFFLMPSGREGTLAADLPELAQRWTLLRSDAGVSLYEYPDAMPRSFIATQVEVEPDEDKLLARLKVADLRRTALLEERLPAGLPDPQATDALPRAQIVDYTPNRVVVEAQSAGGGLLVLTDQYDAGWRASIDSAPARIYRTDYLFRGVQIPAGTHRVEFAYRPLSFMFGVLGSAIGLLVVVMVWRMEP